VLLQESLFKYNVLNLFQHSIDLNQCLFQIVLTVNLSEPNRFSNWYREGYTSPHLILYRPLNRSQLQLQIIYIQEQKSCTCFLFYDHIDFMVLQSQIKIPSGGTHIYSATLPRCTYKYNYILYFLTCQ